MKIRRNCGNGRILETGDLGFLVEFLLMAPMMSTDVGFSFSLLFEFEKIKERWRKCVLRSYSDVV